MKSEDGWFCSSNNEHLSQRMGSAGLERVRVEFNWASRGQALQPPISPGTRAHYGSMDQL
jgi:hypothetical protein